MAERIRPSTGTHADGRISIPPTLPPSSQVPTPEPPEPNRFSALRQRIEALCDLLSAMDYLLLRIATVGAAAIFVAHYLWGR